MDVVVRSGAKTRHGYGDLQHTSDIFGVNSGENDHFCKESSDSYSLKGESDQFTDRDIEGDEFDNYRSIIEGYYENYYNKKFKKLSELFKKAGYSDISEVSEKSNSITLSGLGFWSDYYKTLQGAFERSKIDCLQLEDPLSKRVSEACYNIDTRGLCSGCKYNHIKDCVDIVPGSENQNCLDIVVKHAKSGKLIDSFRVSLDPKGDDKKLINKINICIKSKRSGKMEDYKTEDKCFNREVGTSRVPKDLELENVFSSMKSHCDNCCSNPKLDNPGECYTPNYMNSTPGKTVVFESCNNNFCLLGKSDDGSSETLCDCYKCNKPSYEGCGVTVNNLEQTCTLPEMTKVPHVYGHFCNNSALENTNSFEHKNENNLTKLNENEVHETKKNNNDTYVSFEDIKRNEKAPKIDAYYQDNEPENKRSVRFDYYSEGYDYVSDDVQALLQSGIKLHGFKINNKGVNVPLFLNIGSTDSVYSGQGFVSTTNIGLFNISVVKPIEPEMTLCDKALDILGWKSKNPTCKCFNKNTNSPSQCANFVKTDLFSGFFTTLANYTGIPWLSPGKNERLAIADKCKEDRDTNVCDFHKNLLNKKVDRNRFGKDFFCHLKYYSSITVDKPIDVMKNIFVSGSNVSSFFNGFYEQLLCVGDTNGIERNDLVNRHKFTFIIRSLKGKKYGRNFAILNTTTGQHLCLDLLTHELRFDQESKFSKYLVPAIFKIIPLDTIIHGLVNDTFNCYNVGSNDGHMNYSNNRNNVERDFVCPTYISTTDQYVNIVR